MPGTRRGVRSRLQQGARVPPWARYIHRWLSSRATSTGRLLEAKATLRHLLDVVEGELLRREEESDPEDLSGTAAGGDEYLAPSWLA